MEVDQLIGYLDDAKAAAGWLAPLGIADTQRAHDNLVTIAELGVTVDLLATLCCQLEEHLPRLSDPDMALNNLDRMFSAARNPLSLASLMERDPETLNILLQIFSSSQHLSEVLFSDPESYDLLRVTEGQPVARELLVEEICSETAAYDELTRVGAALRRIKRRETLRIAYGDIIRGQRVEVVTKQISILADAICEAALRACWRDLEKKRGTPRRADGERAKLVVLALGKLGGVELNYSSDIDLMFLYDEDGQTDGSRTTSNLEFFDRLARNTFKLLSEATELGALYRVDMRLRPEGSAGPMVSSLEAAMNYYDVMGRTWERQAFVKARPIAGDLDLGVDFLERLEPWIYRRYLTLADITGIKALKRRIEQRTHKEGDDHTNVKTGHGGIRDIEFSIQFLQLLNGGDLPKIRTGNTLQAIVALEQVGCLNMQERSILEENYAFLRKIEHRLQFMFDLQTHTLPESDDELRKLAIRMGYAGTPHAAALAAFQKDFENKTQLNRKILDHLLHDAFGNDSATEPEVDLVLDPNPQQETIEQVLGRFGFRDVPQAYKNLMALADEKVRFLSTRRCRHFLASIAPRLLAEIAKTPDPDATLVDLSKVSDSLGGKGVLWELFSFNPPTLQLYVRLCASSPYLTSILTSHPGMIDELMDSLVLDRLPSYENLQAMLAELCKGAEDIEPIMHSFKNSIHLRVGVRDILGKEDIQTTQRVLSDVAQVCLQEIAGREQEKLEEKFGQPIIAEGERAGEPCELIILGMGKLGGREPNYHSDLDIIFLYEAEGNTQPSPRMRRAKTTSNQHFFGQLGQRIIKVVNQLGPHGRLYELDPRLRPTGRSGSLAVSLAGLAKYFESGDGQLWERQALCKARPVHGSDEAGEMAMQVVRHAIKQPRWQRDNADSIRQMRYRLQETATPLNLKRGSGGTVDIEFSVQMLQMANALKHPAVLLPGTLDALAELASVGAISEEDHQYLDHSYRFLRSIEARLRLMNTTARHDLPADADEQRKLAYLLYYASSAQLMADAEKHTSENRARFEKLFDAATGGSKVAT